MESKTTGTWTASDACKGGALLEKNGHLFIVSGVQYDGTIEATCVETIRPDERDGWSLHLPNASGQGMDA